ncbi:MAG: phosphoribosylglycinamide formyltransferase [Alphaproteobacteria bacterium]|nr:phosphoribosylglycinamide formyltransferase [Alphaproteobacteria bacterium]
MIRVAILISGRGSNMRALIEAARAPDYPAEIALVISSRPDAEGLAIAQSLGVATELVDQTRFRREHRDREAYDAELHRVLTTANIEFICLAGFMRILSPGFVRQWNGRIINIHPSLLPAFRGLKPQAQALAAGAKISGCTVHYVVPELDAGPAIAQAEVPVLAGDTEETLSARILEAEHRLYASALKKLLSRGRTCDTIA